MRYSDTPARQRLLSSVVYGMAFDFFTISGSLFVEVSTDSKIRSSAQGLFMMMTNGFGAIFGSLVSGYMIDRYFTTNGAKDWPDIWPDIWLAFAGDALAIAVAFTFMFRHKHNPKAVENFSHGAAAPDEAA